MTKFKVGKLYISKESKSTYGGIIFRVLSIDDEKNNMKTEILKNPNKDYKGKVELVHFAYSNLEIDSEEYQPLTKYFKKLRKKYKKDLTNI